MRCDAGNIKAAFISKTTELRVDIKIFDFADTMVNPKLGWTIVIFFLAIFPYSCRTLVNL